MIPSKVKSDKIDVLKQVLHDIKVRNDAWTFILRIHALHMSIYMCMNLVESKTHYDWQLNSGLFCVVACSNKAQMQNK